jgi:hypothetical protein
MDVLGEKPSDAPGMPGIAQFGTFRQQQIQQQFGEGGDAAEGEFTPKFFQNPSRNPYKPADSGSLPPPPAFLSAWKNEQTSSTGYDCEYFTSYLFI